MKRIKENRLKKVKLFLIYNKTNSGNSRTHSLTNILSDIRCIRINEYKECDF